MSRVVCSNCEIRFTSDLLQPCPSCMQPLCRNCFPEHVASHRIVEAPSQKFEKHPKKKKEDEERGSLSDA